MNNKKEVGRMINEKIKRPDGITAIAILWIIVGLYNTYTGLNSTTADIEALAYLNNPQLNPWLATAIPIELAIVSSVSVFGICQIITAAGLLSAKRFSYNAARFLIFVVPIINLSLAALYISAPTELGLIESIRLPLILAGTGVVWLVIYWRYLKKSHVKEYLGVA